jgi:hypothetical protein
MPVIEEPLAKSLRSPPAGPPPPDEFRVAADRLRAELDLTIQALKRSFHVQREVIALSVFDTAFRAGTIAIAAAAAFALAVASALLFVNGARRGMTLWTRDAWWSDLVVAAAIGAVVALVAHTVRRRVHRAVLARTLARLESPPSPATGGKTP